MKRHVVRRALTRRTDGFVLLLVLWILLGAAALLALLTSAGVGLAGRAEVARTDWEARATAETAVHESMYQLMASGDAGFSALSHIRSPQPGWEVHVTGSLSKELSSINGAADTARKLPDGRDLAEAMGASPRPVMAYGELAGRLNLSNAEFACLLSSVTLAHHVEPVDEGHSLAGSSVRLDALVHEPRGGARRLVVDVILTGRLDRPYQITEWFWATPIPPELAGRCRPSRPDAEGSPTPTTP